MVSALFLVFSRYSTKVSHGTENHSEYHGAATCHLTMLGSLKSKSLPFPGTLLCSASFTCFTVRGRRREWMLRIVPQSLRRTKGIYGEPHWNQILISYKDPRHNHEKQFHNIQGTLSSLTLGFHRTPWGMQLAAPA